MKPARFEYQAPETLTEALALLEAEPSAVPIAGGHSLMPVLNFRLATPAHLVDRGTSPSVRMASDSAPE